MTEGDRRQCRRALTRKNTETNDDLQLALFSSNHWSEESRQVNRSPERALAGLLFGLLQPLLYLQDKRRRVPLRIHHMEFPFGSREADIKRPA